MADLGYSLAWRVLDAQHFGVPQRRRRVFILGRRTGDPLSPAEVLFKSEGLRRNTTQSKQTRQDTSTSTARSFGQTGFAGYTEGPATLTATSYKRPEDNVVVNGFTSSSFAQYKEGAGTLRQSGGDLGGGSETLLVHFKQGTIRG
jgi:DNA (cytosine-5)-methyltransferase 1